MANRYKVEIEGTPSHGDNYDVFPTINKPGWATKIKDENKMLRERLKAAEKVVDALRNESGSRYSTASRLAIGYRAKYPAEEKS